MPPKHVPYNNNQGRYVKYVPSQNFNPRGTTIDGNNAYVISAPTHSGFGCSDCSHPGIYSSTNVYPGSQALLERPGLGVDPFLLKKIDQIENQHVNELELLRRDYERGLLEIERENHRKEVQDLKDKIHQLEQQLLVRRAQPTTAPVVAPTNSSPTLIMSAPAPAPPAVAPVNINEHIDCNFNNSERIIALNQQISELEAELDQQQQIQEEQKKIRQDKYKELQRELTSRNENLKQALDDALADKQQRDRRELARENKVESLQQALADLDRKNRDLDDLVRLQTLENRELLAKLGVLDGDLRNLRSRENSPKNSSPAARVLSTLSPSRSMPVIVHEPIPAPVHYAPPPYPIYSAYYPTPLAGTGTEYRSNRNSPLRSTRTPDDPYRHLNGYERPRDSQVIRNRTLRRNQD